MSGGGDGDRIGGERLGFLSAPSGSKPLFKHVPCVLFVLVLVPVVKGLLLVLFQHER